MSKYVIIKDGFYRHPKTMRLKRVIGEAAFWVPPRIWDFAKDYAPDGNLSRFTAQEIADGIDYKGDADVMLRAVGDAGFLDPDGSIHDWGEHAAFHKINHERAKKAAKARWADRAAPSPTPPSQEEIKSKEMEKKGKENSEHNTSMPQACSEHATSIQPSPPSAGSGKDSWRLTQSQRIGLEKDRSSREKRKAELLDAIRTGTSEQGEAAKKEWEANNKALRRIQRALDNGMPLSRTRVEDDPLDKFVPQNSKAKSQWDNPLPGEVVEVRDPEDNPRLKRRPRPESNQIQERIAGKDF